jgi:uncharacterized membrane protein YtjA (UPF0391 family)
MARGVLSRERNGWQYRVAHQKGRETVDLLLIIGIILLLVALLGVGGVIGALADIAWILLILAVIVIAWRIISGRRAV